MKSAISPNTSARVCVRACVHVVCVRVYLLSQIGISYKVHITVKYSNLLIQC